jgi:integrase
MSQLPKTRFNLKFPKTKKETLIFMVFRYRGKKLLYSTGLNILPKEWNFKTQRPFDLERRNDLWSIRNTLDDLSQWCRSIYIDHEYGRISISDFKYILDERLGRKAPEPEEKKISLFEFIDQEIATLKAENFKKSSLKPYLVHANVLKEFAEENGEFSFEDVDWNFRTQLIDWLSEREIKLSYGNKTLELLKRFLERARRKQLHNNTKYQGSGWLVPQKKAIGQKIILNPDELQFLSELELSGYLKRVRDLFLVGAGTGQRFSDYSRLKPHHFYKTVKGTPILSLIAQKTDVPAKVPLNIFPWLLPLLEEYKYTSPILSMQKLNDGLKILCKDAGFDQPVLLVEQYMGRKAIVRKDYRPKYELITTHTCRRSFATNLYRMGYTIGQIMPMTGHATEGNLRTYIGIDAEENAEEVAQSIERRKANRKNN